MLELGTGQELQAGERETTTTEVPVVDVALAACGFTSRRQRRHTRPPPTPGHVGYSTTAAIAIPRTHTRTHTRTRTRTRTRTTRTRSAGTTKGAETRRRRNCTTPLPHLPRPMWPHHSQRCRPPYFVSLCETRPLGLLVTLLMVICVRMGGKVAAVVVVVSSLCRSVPCQDVRSCMAGVEWVAVTLLAMAQLVERATIVVRVVVAVAVAVAAAAAAAAAAVVTTCTAPVVACRACAPRFGGSCNRRPHPVHPRRVPRDP